MNRIPMSLKAALLAGAASSLIAPAFAQETVADGINEGDEIVVTARRRGESLQDVPLAVTSLDGESLEEIGTPDITYIAQTVPNVTLEVSRGTNTTLTAFIRGVGQQDPVAGFEAGVGIYVDDVYLNRPQGVVLDIYNVERIEVLRGPQGTLYGRNTIGGAVKYVTKKLGSEPTATVRGTVGTFNQRDIVATAEMPLTDSLRIGGAIASYNRDGFGENITTGAENYNKEIIAGRATIEFEPTDRFFSRLSADYLEDTSNARGGYREIPNQLAGGDGVLLANEFDTAGGIEGPNELEAFGVAFTNELRLTDTLTAKSITAYREDETVTQIDFDALPVMDVDVPTIYENEQFTQELQLTYEGDGVSGVGGIYYIDANAFNTFDVVLDATGQLFSLPGFNVNTTGDVDTESWAVFSDFSFDLERLMGLPGFELSVGGRYTEDTRESLILRRQFIGGRTDPLGGDGAIQIATDTDFTGEATFTDFSPRISIGYSPNADHNFYASYSQGFKGGGFDPRGNATQAGDVNGDGVVDDADLDDLFGFDPEEVDSYEIGWKSSLLDGRFKNAMALFYADYTDVQVPGSAGVEDPDTGANTFAGVTTNAGEAEFFGFELEGSLLWSDDVTGVGDSFTTNYSLGLIDAEFNEYVTRGAGNAPVDIADDAVVQNTPDTTASLTTNYTRPLAGGALSLITVTSHRGDTNQFEIRNDLIDQEAYTLFDASLVWTSDDGKYQLGLHGKNLTDERYRVAGYSFLAQDFDGTFTSEPPAPTLGLTGIGTAFYGPPRQVFATAQVRF